VLAKHGLCGWRGGLRCPARRNLRPGPV
jgi:hypothetical protein